MIMNREACAPPWALAWVCGAPLRWSSCPLLSAAKSPSSLQKPPVLYRNPPTDLGKLIAPGCLAHNGPSFWWGQGLEFPPPRPSTSFGVPHGRKVGPHLPEVCARIQNTGLSVCGLSPQWSLTIAGLSVSHSLCPAERGGEQIFSKPGPRQREHRFLSQHGLLFLKLRLGGSRRSSRENIALYTFIR